MKKVKEMAEKISFYGIRNTQRYRLLSSLIKEMGIKATVDVEQETGIRNFVIPAEDDSNGIIVLMAHYDVVEYKKTTGFLDNGTAVSMLLKMKAEKRIPKNVEIVFDDLEEVGGYGAAFYLEKNLDRIERIINVDIIGCGDVIYLDNEDSDAFTNTIANKHKCIPFKVPDCDHQTIMLFTTKLTTLCSGFNKNGKGNFNKTLREDILPLMHGGKSDTEECYDLVNEEIIKKTMLLIEDLVF